MRRTDLLIALLAAIGSAVAFFVSLQVEEGAGAGVLLGILLLIDAVARFQLARRG
jgi:hypothetical protein